MQKGDNTFLIVLRGSLALIAITLFLSFSIGFGYKLAAYLLSLLNL